MAKQNPVLIRNEHEEQRQVRHDLVFVITMNVIFLAILIALFFINKSTGAVDKFFANLLKF